MKLEEALNLCAPDEYLAREKWIEAGIFMRVLTNAKTANELTVTLTEESLNADDWEIFEVKE